MRSYLSRMFNPRKRSGSPGRGPIIGKEQGRSSAAIAEEGARLIAPAPVCSDQFSPAARAHVSLAVASDPFAPPPPQQSQPTQHPPHQQLPLLDQVTATSYINAVYQHQLLLSQQHSQHHLQPQQSQAMSLGLHNLMLYNQYFN